MKSTGSGGADGITVLLLGNLQAGKTLLFRRLCGERFAEMAIPDSSMKLSRGVARTARGRLFDKPPVVLLDTPGTGTLFPEGEEELISRDAVLKMSPDVLLLVADAKNLRRSLALAVQAAELGLPMVVALNMEDEAWSHGIEIDAGLLSSILGVEVVPTVATTGKGIWKLEDGIRAARVPARVFEVPHRLKAPLEKMEGMLEELGPRARGLALLLLGGDEGAERLVRDRLGERVLERVEKIAGEVVTQAELPMDVVITEALYLTAGRIASQVVSRRGARGGPLRAFGRWAHHPVAGLFIALAVIAVMYLWVGKLGATIVVDAINDAVFDGFLVPALDGLVSHIPYQLIRDAIMDRDFGLVPTGLFLAFGLVMPVLLFFYFIFNILIESGYLPRLSILLDRIFRLFGLNGKGILPLTMGFSCVTMALITTRMLDSKKERLVASFLLILGTPCAPLLGVMLIVLGGMPISATVALFGFLIIQKIGLGLLANKVVPGKTSDFILQIPPMRVPRLRTVAASTVRQTFHFMKEAVPLFLLASLVMFTVDRLGGLDALERVSEPVVSGMLGLPEATVQVFIKTLIRREAGAAELEAVSGGFDNLQLVVTMLVMVTLTPCVNAVMVLFKERGFKTGLILLVGVALYSVLIGSLFNLACRAMGVTFT